MINVELNMTLNLLTNSPPNTVFFQANKLMTFKQAICTFYGNATIITGQHLSVIIFTEIHDTGEKKTCHFCVDYSKLDR